MVRIFISVLLFIYLTSASLSEEWASDNKQCVRESLHTYCENAFKHYKGIFEKSKKGSEDDKKFLKIVDGLLNLVNLSESRHFKDYNCLFCINKKIHAQLNARLLDQSEANKFQKPEDRDIFFDEMVACAGTEKPDEVNKLVRKLKNQCHDWDFN